MTGRNLLDLLGQDEVWQTRDGSVVPVESLSPEHRTNLLGWLHRRARGLQLAEQMRFCSMPMPAPHTVAFDIVMEGLDEALAMPPGEWLEEQALVRRLRELDEEAA